jgi:hypothetical protein
MNFHIGNWQLPAANINRHSFHDECIFLFFVGYLLGVSTNRLGKTRPARQNKKLYYNWMHILYLGCLASSTNKQENSEEFVTVWGNFF